MVYDNDLKMLKARRENHMRYIEGMWQRIKELENLEGEPCALTHGICASNLENLKVKQIPIARI